MWVSTIHLTLHTPPPPSQALRQRSRGAQSLLVSHSEARWSTYRPVTRPDTVLLARLLQVRGARAWREGGGVSRGQQ